MVAQTGLAGRINNKINACNSDQVSVQFRGGTIYIKCHIGQQSEILFS
jgi:hypothetical protein